MATNTLAPPRPATGVERDSITERIWQGTDLLVHGRFQEAHTALEQDGRGTSARHTVELARAMQLQVMQEAETPGPDGHAPIEDWNTSKVTANRMTLLLLGLPSAAEAQDRIDNHSSHDKPADVALLSGFNQEIAGVLAHMPPAMMDEFPDRLLRRSNNLLKGKWGLPVMDERNIAITMAGARREAAVLRALHQTLPEEWSVRQTSTEEDLRGSDLVVYNPDGWELRMDIKSRNGFDHAVDDMLRQGIISREQADRAREKGVVYRRSKDQTGEKVYNCIFDADQMGQINNYEYDDPFNVFEFVEHQFEEQSQSRLRKLGKHAIIVQSQTTY
jgi:hypothetical protein